MEIVEGSSSIGRAAVALAVATMLAGVVWASPLTGWTTVGSAGTVDESSTSIVGFSGPSVGFKTSCLLAFLKIHCSVATGTVTVRYNIVPTGALYVTQPSVFVALALSARFRDTGTTQRVLLLLKEVNLQSGDENPLLTVDSDLFNSSPNYQTQTGPRACAFGLNFDENAYYVE